METWPLRIKQTRLIRTLMEMFGVEAPTVPRGRATEAPRRDPARRKV